MKKTMMTLVSVIAAVTAIGNASVNAHAAEELTVNNMQELVAELKHMDHFESVTYKDADFEVHYTYDIKSKEMMEEWYNHLSVADARKVKEYYGVTPEYIVSYYTEWHLVTTQSYNPFYSRVMT